MISVLLRLLGIKWRSQSRTVDVFYRSKKGVKMMLLAMGLKEAYDASEEIGSNTPMAWERRLT